MRQRLLNGSFRCATERVSTTKGESLPLPGDGAAKSPGTGKRNLPKPFVGLTSDYKSVHAYYLLFRKPQKQFVRNCNFTFGKEMTLQFLTKRYISSPEPNTKPELHTMKVLSSLASMKRRHADCQIVKRKGTLYVICKSNPKFKARQGATAGTRLSKKGVK